MADIKPSGFKRLPKESFSRRALSRRVKRAQTASVRHARRFVIRRWSNVRDARQQIVLWIIAMGILIGAAGLQFIWYQAGYRANAAATYGTYAEAVLGPVDTLNPLLARSSAEQSAARLMFSSLLAMDDTGHLNNDLATSVTVDDAHTTYTVKLRPDAKWSDGYFVTADDVVFTAGLLKNPAVHSIYGSGWSNITVRAVDDLTVNFTLPSVYAAFKQALTFPIVPEHVLKGIAPESIRESGFSSVPVGSGPFVFRLLQDVGGNQKVIHMMRNTDYYGGQAKIDRFQLSVYTTSDQILRALSTAEVNAAVDLPASQVSKVDTRRYKVETKPISSGVYALFNTQSQILKDQAVRQALQAGTDTSALRKAVDNAPQLYLPFVNGQLSGDIPAAPVYDVNQAKQLLDNDGWKLDGSIRAKDGKQLRLIVVTTKDIDLEKTLEKVTSQWRQLGVAVTTNIVDPSDPNQNVTQNILQPRNFDVLISPMTIGADPDVYAYWHSSQATRSGSNFSNYSNPISDDALGTARTRLEPEIRNAKYLIFARQWLKDVPAVGLYQSTIHYVANKSVNGLPNNSVLVSETDRYADVLNWSVGTRGVYTTP
jgi:peptide/nickel transport system substrate-binding protein